MPEGNEVHRYQRLQSPIFAGRKLVVEAPNGRFEAGAQQLTGRKLNSIDAYGKHLLYDFGKNRHLHIHLGRFGKFRDGELPVRPVQGALRLRFISADHWLELRGPTACEVFTEEQKSTLLNRIGPDPLRDDANPKTAWTRISKSPTAIGALLMDQSVISGIGNIYRAELLFRARLSPFRPGGDVPRGTFNSIWKESVVLLAEGMTDRRIVTTRPADRPHPQGKARRGEVHYVYRRSGLPCFICGTKVQTREFVGRDLYWCPSCQAE